MWYHRRDMRFETTKDQKFSAENSKYILRTRNTNASCRTLVTFREAVSYLRIRMWEDASRGRLS